MADKTMKFDITAKDNASRTFAQIGVSLDRLSTKLDELGRKEVKPRVTADTERSKTRVEELGAALRALGNQRLRVDVDMGPGRSEVGDLRRDLSYLRNVKVKVDLTVPPAAQVTRVQQLREALRELDGINANATVAVVGNLPDAAELRRAASALKDLQDVHDIAIHISITGAVDALAQVAALRRELRAIPAQTTTTVNVDVDKGALARVANVGSTLAKLGAAGGLAAAGLGSAVPAAATLAGSLASLVGLVPVAVAGLAAMGVTAVVLKVGLKGVGDALKESDPKKYAESLKGLAPAAQQFVTAYRQLKPAFDQVQLGTQQKLFDGLGASVKQLSAAYLPSMKTNLGGVATELNGAAKNVVAFARAGQTMQDVNTIFDNTRVALHNAAPAANNLLGSFRDIATVGSDFLPGLATGWTNATQRFQTFISEARESGQLKVWIQSGIDTLQTLGSISGNVGSVLMSVFTAAKASGADFLTTLDKVTGKLADLLASDTGQSALTAFFRESRQAIDALMPGVEALATGVLKMIQSFSTSGGLQTFAGTVSGIAQSLAPLLPMLGDLAGNVLKDLSNGASVAAGALGPIVGVVTGVVGALGPLPALVIASVVAFKALGSAAIAGSFATLASRLTMLAPAIGTYAAGLTGSLAAGNAAQGAATRLGTAIGKVGSALPIVGVALIGLGAAYEAFSGKADEAAARVLNGSESMQAAIAGEAEQIHKNQIEWLGGMNAQESYAAASKNVTEEVAKQRAELGPMAQLQSDVSRAQADLNDAVAQFGATSPQATSAASRLTSATGALKDAHDGAAQAAMTQDEKEQALANTMSGQIGSALAYAQAVQRTAEAHKAADEALKSGGAKSEEYKGAVLSLAAAMSSQADAARKQAEALGGAAAGTQAYNTEILRSADLSTQAGRDAFAQLADGLDDTGLAAITAAAKLSGLRTEVVTLPDGRKVTVVVDADRAKLDSVKQGVEEIAGKEFVGTVKILGETEGFRGSVTQSLELANGTVATMKIAGDGSPALLTVGATKYQVDATTGTLKILGDPAPGEVSLNGFKVKTDATTGVMTIEGNTGPVDAKTAGAKNKADTSIGTLTLDGNPAPVNGKVTSAVTFADGSKGTITIDGNQTPANGKVNATVTYADGRTGVIKVDANAAAANSAIDNAARNRTTTIFVTYSGTQTASDIYGGASASAARKAGGGITGYSGGGIHRASRGMVLPGYAPGRDTELAWLSRGESVLVPELTRQLGARRILAANAEASGGRPATNTGNIASLMDGRIRPSGGGVAAPGPTIALSRRAAPTAGNSAGAGGGLDVRTVVAAIRQAGMASNGQLDQLAAALERVGEALRSARPITVEDRSGNPTETARATQLALRLTQ